MDQPVITFDIDWSPDFVIESITNQLIDHKIKSTWFVTHKSPVIDKLRKNKLFEFGLHPNFEVNSTHGDTPDEVLKFMKGIIPEAKSIRAHKLFQSSTILNLFQKYGIENDSSIILPHVKYIYPHYISCFNLYRFPIFWEDDAEFFNKPNWMVNPDTLKETGVQIYNFHPIHIYLNSQNIGKYNLLKEEIGMNNLTVENIKPFINGDKGVRTFFEQLLEYSEGGLTIQDMQKWYL